MGCIESDRPWQKVRWAVPLLVPVDAVTTIRPIRDGTLEALIGGTFHTELKLGLILQEDAGKVRHCTVRVIGQEQSVAFFPDELVA